MLQEWQTVKVVEILDANPGTKRFFIQLDSVSSFDFKPGQFVTLDLPIHEKKNKRLRSYSIASAPDGTNIIELIIVLVEDGLGTPFLFSNIKVGDEMILRGPQGVFVLHEPLEHDLFLICTGTGIAPFRSMVKYLYQTQIEFSNVYLIFGTRTQQELLYFDEMTELAAKMPNFHYIPVLSRETWEGKSGYVHAVYQELAQGNPKANFMLCGWKNMIDDARKNLSEMGYDKSHIHFELYG
jgi:ferredoxin-NADP reductase